MHTCIFLFFQTIIITAWKSDFEFDSLDLSQALQTLSESSSWSLDDLGAIKNQFPYCNMKICGREVRIYTCLWEGLEVCKKWNYSVLSSISGRLRVNWCNWTCSRSRTDCLERFWEDFPNMFEKLKKIAKIYPIHACIGCRYPNKKWC